MQLYISTCAAMSTLAIWCRLVHSRDVSPYIFDGPAMSGLAFSVAPFHRRRYIVVILTTKQFQRIRHLDIAAVLFN